MNTSKSRLPEWDFVKAILIIFVIWGHVCSYISDSSYEKNALTSVIRLYQMPMFILISGYFQRASHTLSDIKERAIRILRSLCVPYLCWCCIGSVLAIGANAAIGTETYRGGINLIRILGQEANLLWFFGCLILCESMYAVVSVFVEKFGAVWLYLSMVPAIILPVEIWHFSFLWPFFILGVIIRKKDVLDYMIQLFQRQRGCIGLVVGVGLFGLSQLYKTEYTFYNTSNYLLSSGVSGAWRQLLFVTARYAVYGVTTVSYLCIFLVIYNKVNNRGKTFKFLLDLGRNTLGIFCIHIICLYHVLRPLVVMCTYGAGILAALPAVRYYIVAGLISAAAVALSYLFTKLIKRKRILDFLLLGR